MRRRTSARWLRLHCRLRSIGLRRHITEVITPPRRSLEQRCTVGVLVIMPREKREALNALESLYGDWAAIASLIYSELNPLTLGP